MAEHNVRKPGFGTRLRNDQYYKDVNAIIELLRSTASQRTIAAHLNSVGFRTPRNLPWDRQKLANYLRRTGV